MILFIQTPSGSVVPLGTTVKQARRRLRQARAEYGEPTIERGMVIGRARDERAILDAFVACYALGITEADRLPPPSAHRADTDTLARLIHAQRVDRLRDKLGQPLTPDWRRVKKDESGRIVRTGNVQMAGWEGCLDDASMRGPGSRKAILRGRGADCPHADCPHPGAPMAMR